MKLSEMYGMQIESKDKKKRGFILGISCVKNVIEGVICCDERENKFFVKGENLLCGGGKITFSRIEKCAPRGASLRLGRAVYTVGGMYLGRLEDCTLKNFRITGARVGRKNYPFERLVLGDVIILKDGLPSAERAARDMLLNALL